MGGVIIARRKRKVPASPTRRPGLQQITKLTGCAGIPVTAFQAQKVNNKEVDTLPELSSESMRI